MKKRTLFVTLGLALAVVVTGCGGGGGEAGSESASAPAGPAPSAAPPSGPTGMVTGTISYSNGDPDIEIAMDADPQCMQIHGDTPVETERIVGAAGKLANVFIYVKEGAPTGMAAPDEPHELDQKGCRYVPHVSGMMVGQTLNIRNSDPFLHNVHAVPEKNDEFNNGQPFPGVLEKSFDEVEVMIPFKCDVHPWMAAYLAVLDHPFFAVSGENGTYEIDNLPAGDYVLEAWHETLGTQQMNVTVEADAASAASFEFAPAG